MESYVSELQLVTSHGVQESELQFVTGVQINEIEVQISNTREESQNETDEVEDTLNNNISLPENVPVQSAKKRKLTIDSKPNNQKALDKITIKKNQKAIKHAKQHIWRRIRRYQALKNQHTTLKMQVKLENQGYQVFEKDPSKRFIKVIKTDFTNDDPPDLKLD